MELKRFIALSRDFAADSRFLEAIGMKSVVEGVGWAAFASDGGPEGPVELLSAQPMDGFSVAPGFEVEDLDAIYTRLAEMRLTMADIIERPRGRYFFAQDHQGRFWHFFQS